MKKVGLIIAIAMVAGVASAALWTEDFTGVDPSVTIEYADPVYVSLGDEQFGAKSDLVTFEDGNVLKMWSATAGASRYTVASLAANNFTGQGGNTLTVNNHVSWVGTGNGTSYSITIYEASGNYNVDTTTGAASANLNELKSWTWTQAGLRSQDITYTDGTDLVLVYGVTGNAAQGKITLNSVEVIPEPATFSLMAAIGAGLVYVRRRFGR